MTRWQPDARGRLAEAAMALFQEQGFQATTVPQIAERAGLTTRTFFRHYTDKREVFFAYQQDLPDVVAEVMASAPPELTPMEVVAAGLRRLAVSQFEPAREHFLAHRAVVLSDDGLRERELWKRSILGDAMHAGFVARGADDLTATLAAELGVTAFSVASARWLDDEAGRPMVDHVDETLARLTAMSTTSTREPTDATTRTTEAGRHG